MNGKRVFFGKKAADLFRKFLRSGNARVSDAEIKDIFCTDFGFSFIAVFKLASNLVLTVPSKYDFREQ